jgi:hypothetical protein
MLICDIQGVNDLYTDPQIHNRDGTGFGRGNLGSRGFDRFLATHRCNHICRYLKLPQINAKLDDAGTRPATTIMSYHQVDVVNVHSYLNPAIALDGNVPRSERPALQCYQEQNPKTPLLKKSQHAQPRRSTEHSRSSTSVSVAESECWCVLF